MRSFIYLILASTLTMAACSSDGNNNGNNGASDVSNNGSPDAGESDMSQSDGSVNNGEVPEACLAGAGIFGEDRVHDLNLTLSDADWDRMKTEQANSPEYGGPDKRYYSAEMTFDGEALGGPVGLRLKGHFSLVNADGDKFPLKIDFNRYTDRQKYQDLGKLNLHPAGQGAESALNEFLSYGSVNAGGVPTARVSLARVRLNGEDLGFYSLVEQIDGRFIACHFPEPRGQLYKPEEGNGNLQNFGPDFSDYPSVEHKWPEDADHTAFLNLVATINAGDLAAFDDVLVMDGVLSYFAINTAIGNPDTYASTGHNYYLYESVPGKFTMIPWDLNISQTAETDPCGAAGRNDENYPLSYYPLGDPDLTAQYASIATTFLDGEGSVAKLNQRLNLAVTLLTDAGAEGVSSTADEMRTNFTTRVNGLKGALPNLTTCP